MSEINERMISEFLELLKKVNSLEMQVQNISKDHSEVMTKCTRMMQTLQDTFSESLKKQNALVQQTNDSLANQVNSVLSKVGDAAVSSARSYLEQNKDDEKLSSILIHNNEMELKIEKLIKTMSLITHAFKEAESFQQAEEAKNPSLLTPIPNLPFTIRTVRCLMAENIETLGELVRCTESRLLKTPNMGRKTLREILNFLKDSGLELRKVE